MDVTGSADFLSTVQSSLEAAIESLSPGTLFGILTFSSHLGLYGVGVKGGAVGARWVALSLGNEGGGAPAEVALEDALPLEHALAGTGEGGGGALRR